MTQFTSLRGKQAKRSGTERPVGLQLCSEGREKTREEGIGEEGEGGTVALKASKPYEVHCSGRTRELRPQTHHIYTREAPGCTGPPPRIAVGPGPLLLVPAALPIR